MAPSRQVVYDLDVRGSNGGRTRAAPGVSLKINDFAELSARGDPAAIPEALSSMRP